MRCLLLEKPPRRRNRSQCQGTTCEGGAKFSFSRHHFVHSHTWKTCWGGWSHGPLFFTRQGAVRISRFSGLLPARHWYLNTRFWATTSALADVRGAFVDFQDFRLMQRHLIRKISRPHAPGNCVVRCSIDTVRAPWISVRTRRLLRACAPRCKSPLILLGGYEKIVGSLETLWQ
jgi:hypothetical protein